MAIFKRSRTKGRAREEKNKIKYNKKNLLCLINNREMLYDANDSFS